MRNQCVVRSLIAGLLALFLAIAPASAQKEKQAEGVSLSFANADIETVIRAIGKISNRNILIDPRVKGTLNIVTTKPVTPDVAYQILMSALRLQGYSVVEEGGVIKVVPEADAKTHSVPVSKSRKQLRGERLITHVFHIRNESATQLLGVVRPLISPNNAVTAYASNNTLIVTDYADNVERIARIIDALDVPQGDIVVIPLKHTAVQDIAPVINRLMSDSGGGAPQPAGDASQRVTIAADNRSNALLVRSDNPSRIASIRQLVANMDQPGGRQHSCRVPEERRCDQDRPDPSRRRDRRYESDCDERHHHWQPDGTTAGDRRGIVLGRGGGRRSHSGGSEHELADHYGSGGGL